MAGRCRRQAALSWAARGQRLAPHPLLEPGHCATPVARLMRPVKASAALWPVLFCHGSQQLSFEGWFFTSCSPLMRRALGTVWGREVCSDLRGWQCKIMLSRVKHFHSTYVLIWKCGFSTGCFPFPYFEVDPHPPPQKTLHVTHRIKAVALHVLCWRKCWWIFFFHFPTCSE